MKKMNSNGNTTGRMGSDLDSGSGLCSVVDSVESVGEVGGEVTGRVAGLAVTTLGVEMPWRGVVPGDSGLVLECRVVLFHVRGGTVALDVTGFVARDVLGDVMTDVDATDTGDGVVLRRGGFGFGVILSVGDTGAGDGG